MISNEAIISTFTAVPNYTVARISIFEVCISSYKRSWTSETIGVLAGVTILAHLNLHIFYTKIYLS